MLSKFGTANCAHSIACTAHLAPAEGCSLQRRNPPPNVNDGENLMSTVQVNRDECTACGLCTDVCPQEYFRQPTARGFPDVAEEEGCIAGGRCVAVCPSDAIEHTDFPETTIRSISVKRKSCTVPRL